LPENSGASKAKAILGRAWLDRCSARSVGCSISDALLTQIKALLTQQAMNRLEAYRPDVEL